MTAPARISRQDARKDLSAPPRRHKYGARKTVFDGITFDSKGEADRYAKLKLQKRAELISELELQPRFPLEVNGILVATYVADFSYLDSDGARVIEDFKGHPTPLYRLKRKLFEALYGLSVTEVRA